MTTNVDETKRHPFSRNLIPASLLKRCRFYENCEDFIISLSYTLAGVAQS